jgi:NAD-specific glutamate dehydrogenase
VLSLVLRTQSSLPRAVRIHAGIGHEARITWLIERIGDLDRRDGWERIAAETLVLELLDFQRSTVAPLLALDSSEAGVLDAFRKRNARALHLIEEAAQDIEAADRRGLVPLAVMSQLIRRLS